MRFSIYSDAVGIGILHPVAAVISGVTVKEECPELDEIVDALQSNIGSISEKLKDSAEFQGYRSVLSKMGYSSEPAGERLVRLIQKRGLSRHNNIVDAYNLVAARFGCGIGMHDAELVSSLEIFRASGSERIIPLFSGKEKRVKTGDLIYCSDGTPLAWLGKRDVDSDEFKVTPETTKLLLVALGNSKTTEKFNLGIITEIFALIKLTCPQASIEILDSCFQSV